MTNKLRYVGTTVGVISGPSGNVQSIPKKKHNYYKCSPCKNEGLCQFCDGGLLFCVDCKLGEGELTSAYCFPTKENT